MGSQGTPPVTRDQAEISRLSSAAQELKEQLRAERAQRDDLTVQLHNQHPRKILKRKLHSALGFVQRMTPAPVRAFFRPGYLRFYRRVFPHGLREFGSADLVRSREKNILSPVPKTESPYRAYGFSLGAGAGCRVRMLPHLSGRSSALCCLYGTSPSFSGSPSGVCWTSPMSESS